jgi:polyisoprenyl-phosphate glycosyltransferase
MHMPDALFIAAPAHVERRQPRLAIVLPCYNEQAVVADSAARLMALLDDLVRDGCLAEDSFLLFVDDGSLDRTWASLSALHAAHDAIELLRLAGNAGHQAALLAGMHAVRGRVDACITMDVDLQDDPAAIAEFLTHFRQGADVVLGVRDDRRSDTWLKRNSAGAYYRLQRLLGADIVRHHADFRLLSAVALDLLLAHSERNLYLRGTVSALKLPRALVPCRRLARKAGSTKYTLRHMLALGLDGITSQSIRPLRLLFAGGLAITLLALLAATWIIVGALMGAPLIRGWASILVAVLFLGGVQIMGLGVLGEYIGKAYLETKRRPLGVVGTHLLARRPPAEPAQSRACTM